MYAKTNERIRDAVDDFGECHRELPSKLEFPSGDVRKVVFISSRVTIHVNKSQFNTGAAARMHNP